MPLRWVAIPTRPRERKRVGTWLSSHTRTHSRTHTQTHTQTHTRTAEDAQRGRALSMPNNVPSTLLPKPRSGGGSKAVGVRAARPVSLPCAHTHTHTHTLACGGTPIAGNASTTGSVHSSRGSPAADTLDASSAPWERDIPLWSRVSASSVDVHAHATPFTHAQPPGASVPLEMEIGLPSAAQQSAEIIMEVTRTSPRLTGASGPPPGSPVPCMHNSYVGENVGGNGSARRYRRGGPDTDTGVTMVSLTRMAWHDPAMTRSNDTPRDGVDSLHSSALSTGFAVETRRSSVSPRDVVLRSSPPGTSQSSVLSYSRVSCDNVFVHEAPMDAYSEAFAAGTALDAGSQPRGRLRGSSSGDGILPPPVHATREVQVKRLNLLRMRLKAEDAE